MISRSIGKIAALSVLLFITTQHYIVRAQHIWETDAFRMEMDAKGRIQQLTNPGNGKDYLPKDAKGFLFRIKVDNEELNPEKVEFKRGSLTLRFPGAVEAEVKVEENSSYLIFELEEITPAEKVDVVFWGPFKTTISDTVGEFVGVVRNGEYAIGIQALNPKTTGGALKNEEGVVYARGTTAILADYGSSLQAFTINRNKERTIKVWNKWKDVTVPAIEEGKLTGSKIALFGINTDEALSTIGTIEVQEGLPHPEIDGEWIKQSREPGRPYMISSFSESNVDTILNYAKMAGMAGLYHGGPFDTWGHFILNEDQFPNGRTGLKKCVEKAKKLGLRLGVHILTTFITTDDSFVSPSPDHGLQEIGSSLLTEDLSADDDEIFVQSAGAFKQKTDLQTVRIGEELIRFQKVTASKPCKLTGCIRGAFDTEASDHKNGDSIVKLMDHPYKVFFPDWGLQKELLRNMTDFFNETGVNQMDFDGHEGTYATGMGDYSMDRFAEGFYRQTSHNVVNGSSRSNHYYWHINHYLNWGEPWYGGFRESQSDYRFKNQALLDRNYMPNMLGWFLMSANTTMEDIDWMMARAAGYDAGFAFVVNPDALKKNPQTEKLLNQIKIWEDARQEKIFNEDLLARLKDSGNEFHLEKTSTGSWKLHTFEKYDFSYEKRMLQPGQPTYSEWQFSNNYKKQVPQISLLAKGEQGSMSKLTLEIDHFYELELPLDLKAGQSLVLDESGFARVYNNKGRFVRKIKLEQPLPGLSQGNHLLRFDAEFSSGFEIQANATVKIKGEVVDLKH